MMARRGWSLRSFLGRGSSKLAGFDAQDLPGASAGAAKSGAPMQDFLSLFEAGERPAAEATPRAAETPKASVPAGAPAAPAPPDPGPNHAAEFYLAPSDLHGDTKLHYRAVAIGSCFLQELLGQQEKAAGPSTIDFVVATGSLAKNFAAPADISAYDFQVVQLPVRWALRDVATAQLSYNDVEAHEQVFAEACDILKMSLAQRMKYNLETGLLTFVTNFMVPQFNPNGRLMPRYDLRNTEFFVERLNQELERLVRGYRNAYILDVDRIAASFGRRHLQDDSVYFTGHNALLHGWLEEQDRLERAGSMAQHYELAPGSGYSRAVRAELEAMYRSVRQMDAIKLVVVDLDDTLWRGVSGDAADVGNHMFQGWPYGVAEALLYLKKRGILLAIISKNDETRIRSIWSRIFGRALRLEDFAAVKINWRPKAENMRAILDAVNLLSRNVLFIDDNPAERAAVKMAFPDIRVLGKHAYYLRRTLLLAPELQAAQVSDESARRTEMVQAQGERETRRRALSPAEFHREQQVAVELQEMRRSDGPRFARAFELLNKTNQFNTTGKRWTSQECDALFAAGGKFIVFEVEDRFTSYGLVGVVIVRDAMIEQWAMSCRVIGMLVEQAVMADVVRAMRSDGAAEISGAMIHTDANHACRSLFPDNGFVERGGFWVLPPDMTPQAPQYVAVSVA